MIKINYLTYKNYLKQKKSVLEWKLIEKLSRNPGLMSEINKTFYHALTLADGPIEDEEREN